MIEEALQCERGLAGCLLMEPEATIHAVLGEVLLSDFLDPNAAAIYRAAAALINGAKACDAVIIQTESGVSEEYCRNVMEETPTIRNAGEYARLIHEAAGKRKAQDIGAELERGEIDSLQALAKLQELTRTQSGGILSPQDAAQLSLDIFSSAAEGKAFLNTGYRRLDEMLSGGLINGGMITLAARPGTGKTTAALNIAEYAAAAGRKVLYVSLEMTAAQLWACRIANTAKLNRSDILSGEIIRRGGANMERLYEAYDALYNRPFFIHDAPATVDDIERLARSVNDLALIVIDHMGLIRNTARLSRYEHMTDTAHRIKQIALSLQIPILALCQLNRSSEQRERPTMADLRDSGAIEEDSDAVILLYRQKLPGAQWEMIDYIIDKNRHGQTGILTLGFCGAYSQIAESI